MQQLRQGLSASKPCATVFPQQSQSFRSQLLDPHPDTVVCIYLVSRHPQALHRSAEARRAATKPAQLLAELKRRSAAQLSRGGRLPNVPSSLPNLSATQQLS
jgi:hypothetical protein